MTGPLFPAPRLLPLSTAEMAPAPGSTGQSGLPGGSGGPGAPDTEAVLALMAQHLAAAPGHGQAAGPASGLAVVLVDAAGTRLHVAGWADAARQRPVDAASGFDLGSVTKPLTAALLARLADQGRLSLDDPVQRWLPGLVAAPAAGAEPVRLWHLVTHTSGLPRLPRSWTALRRLLLSPDDPYAHYTRADFERDLAGWTPPVRLPAPFAYSNWGYAVLGRVVEAVLQQPYTQALQDQVLRPAGMAQAGSTPGPQHAVGTHGGQAVPTWQLGEFAAAGCVRATVRDVAALLQALLHHRPPFAAADLQPRADLPPGQQSPRGAVGLGWLLMPRPEGPLVWHNGGTGGFRAFVGTHPARGRAVAVLANAEAEIDPLALHLLDPRLPAPAPEPARRASQAGWGWSLGAGLAGAGALGAAWLWRRRRQGAGLRQG